MIESSCHCGLVKWRFDSQPDHATSCNCTLCRRWAALWAYGFLDEDFHISGATQTYLRDPKTIAFNHCSTCGCVTHWLTAEKGEDGRYYGAVNLRLAEPEDISSIPVRFFDGLDKYESLPSDGRCISDVLWS